MAPEHLFDLFKTLGVPVAVLLVGGLGAVRFALSPGARRQRFFSVVVVLCLAVSAAVSVLKLPAQPEGLKPGNPYPLGIGGMTPGGHRSGMVTPLNR